MYSSQGGRTAVLGARETIILNSRQISCKYMQGITQQQLLDYLSKVLTSSLCFSWLKDTFPFILFFYRRSVDSCRDRKFVQKDLQITDDVVENILGKGIKARNKTFKNITTQRSIEVLKTFLGLSFIKGHYPQPALTVLFSASGLSMGISGVVGMSLYSGCIISSCGVCDRDGTKNSNQKQRRSCLDKHSTHCETCPGGVYCLFF